MQKIISFYTLSYIFIIFCSNILQIIPGISLIREGYILFLMFSLVVYFNRIQITKISVLILLYICSNFASFITSSNPNDALSSFILYISGPIIFILLTSIPLTKNTIQKLESNSDKLFVFFIITAILLFPFQKQFYSIFGLDKEKNFINLYRFTTSGQLKPRLSGLCAHPTSMGAICLFVMIKHFFLKKNKKSILTIIPYYLSNTRSILVGTPFVWFSFLPIKKKVWIILTVPFFILVFLYILLNTVLDSSILIHFEDLIKYGPKLLLGNISLFGNGHGTMSPFTSKSSFIHVESDLYIALMQIGLVGVLLYLIIFFYFIFILLHDNNARSKYCASVLICINVGCIFLSYYAVRFLSNYMWLELSFYYSYRRFLCQK